MSVSTQYDAREKWTGENNILQDFFPLCDLVFVNESELEKLLPTLGGLTVRSIVVFLQSSFDGRGSSDFCSSSVCSQFRPARARHFTAKALFCHPRKFFPIERRE